MTTTQSEQIARSTLRVRLAQIAALIVTAPMTAFAVWLAVWLVIR